MNVYRTYNKNHVIALYSDADIFKKVYTDRADMHGLFTPDFKSVTYIVGFNGDDQIGVLELHPKNNSTGYLHGGILKSQRKYAHEFTEKALGMCFKIYPDLHCILDETPSLHMGTINFVRKCGFEQVGIIKQNVMIHGVLYDTVVQQLNRK